MAIIDSELDKRIRQQHGDEESAQAAKKVEAALKGLSRLVDPDKQNMSLSEVHEEYFSKTSGLLKSRQIDPIAWQKEMRDEWEKG